MDEDVESLQSAVAKAESELVRNTNDKSKDKNSVSPQSKDENIVKKKNAEQRKKS